MSLHFPKFDTILEHAVYAFPEQHQPLIGHEPARTIVTFSRFHLPSQREVLEYIRQKADEVTSVIQHSKETGETVRFQGGIEWRLLEVPTSFRQRLALGNGKEEWEKHLPENITANSQPYLLMQSGTIPQRVITMGQSAQKEKEWYTKMMRRRWSAELQLSSAGSLGDKVRYDISYQNKEQKLPQQTINLLDALYKAKPNIEDLKKIPLLPDYQLQEIAEATITAFLKEKEKDKARIFSQTTSGSPEQPLHASGVKN